ncbi:hypothetical protein BaRGS_00026684, partial [Batillaria attramentaria]
MSGVFGVLPERRRTGGTASHRAVLGRSREGGEVIHLVVLSGGDQSQFQRDCSSLLSAARLQRRGPDLERSSLHGLTLVWWNALRFKGYGLTL